MEEKIKIYCKLIDYKLNGAVVLRLQWNEFRFSGERDAVLQRRMLINWCFSQLKGFGTGSMETALLSNPAGFPDWYRCRETHYALWFQSKHWMHSGFKLNFCKGVVWVKCLPSWERKGKKSDSFVNAFLLSALFSLCQKFSNFKVGCAPVNK